MNKRKICVITTSRADYGQLYWLMKEIQRDPRLKLQIIAAGMHLEPRFGSTYKAIQRDGFKIDTKINMLMKDDTEAGISKSIGSGYIGFANAFGKLKPALVVLLGDRYELLPAATTAVIAKIPIAHIHGGETTEGSIDESIRHSITKMSTLHFPATELYRKRIVQMGENPRFIFNYGAPGLDNLYKLKLLDKNGLGKTLNFVLKDKMAIVTYHPVTLEKNTARGQIINMLRAINTFNLRAIFTMANADTNGSIINREIQKFCEKNKNIYKFFKNLGQITYLSCLKNFDIIIGNSSSGIIESSSFGIPVVNIGDRQKGRVRGRNVIDVGYSKTAIAEGIRLGLRDGFKARIKRSKNPYEKYCDGKVSYRIKEKIKKIEIEKGLLKKKFYDIYKN